MKVSASVNFPEVQRQLVRLGTQVYQQAAVSAINKTAKQAKTAMSREIRREYNLPARKVNESLRISAATFKQGVVNINASLESPAEYGRSLNVIHFLEKKGRRGRAAQISKGKKGVDQDVRFKIKNSSASVVIKGAFVGNKGRTVFRRVGKQRLPIEPVQAVGVPQMFNTRRINEAVQQFVRDKFPEVFAREARYYASKS